MSLIPYLQQSVFLVFSPLHHFLRLIRPFSYYIIQNFICILKLCNVDATNVTQATFSSVFNHFLLKINRPSTLAFLRISKLCATRSPFVYVRHIIPFFSRFPAPHFTISKSKPYYPVSIIHTKTLLYLIRFPIFLHSPLTSLSHYPHLFLNINPHIFNNLIFLGLQLCHVKFTTCIQIEFCLFLLLRFMSSHRVQNVLPVTHKNVLLIPPASSAKSFSKSLQHCTKILICPTFSSQFPVCCIIYRTSGNQ